MVFSDEEGGGEDDDEAESEEKEERPKYRYAYDEPSSRSIELDEFDKAWAKYGYGRSNDRSGSDESSSYESSETQMIPRRIKFYHEKKEEITTPMRHTTEKPNLKITKVVSGGALMHHSQPKKIPQKPTSVKSQDENQKSQRSDAGSDDLKYFQ